MFLWKARRRAEQLTAETEQQWRVRRKYGLRSGYEVYREVDLPDFPPPPEPFFKETHEQADGADMDMQVPPHTL